MDNVNSGSGLTDTEQEIADHLSRAWTLYLSMIKGEYAQDDLTIFRHSIRTCQQILSHRVVCREHAEYWIS